MVNFDSQNLTSATILAVYFSGSREPLPYCLPFQIHGPRFKEKTKWTNRA
jgi:hypothetical protein